MYLILLVLLAFLRESRTQIKVHSSAVVECGGYYTVNSDSQYYFGDEEFGISENTRKNEGSIGSIVNEDMTRSGENINARHPQNILTILYSKYQKNTHLSNSHEAISNKAAQIRETVPLLYSGYLRKPKEMQTNGKVKESWDLFNVMTSKPGHSRNKRDRPTEYPYVIRGEKMDQCTYTFITGPDCKYLVSHFTRANYDQMDCGNQFMRFTDSSGKLLLCKDSVQLKSKEHGRYLQVTSFLKWRAPRVPVEGFVICK